MSNLQQLKPRSRNLTTQESDLLEQLRTGKITSDELLTEVRTERARLRVEAQASGWQIEKEKCANDILYWFDNWVYTYDPRLTGKPGGPFIQMKLWKQQRELITWLGSMIDGSQECLIEKSRDVGATYLCGGMAIHRWLFRPGFKTTFGSLTVDEVDKKDNPDSIFAKLRIMLRRQPEEFMPKGFKWAHHDNYLRIFNPETEAIISGDGGENMGRSGRSSWFVLDEAAHVPHAETVEKALSGNTDCVTWVSSVNGMGNLFARKRHSLLKADHIFKLHWRSDPRKTEEWAAAKQASFSDPTTWASEYDIDYSASVPDVCIPALWVESAKRLLSLEKRLKPANSAVLGLDVGAGKAKSVAIPKRGPVVVRPKSRGAPDTTETAHWALEIARLNGSTQLNFDAVGVGAGVSSTLMLNPVKGLQVVAVNTGVPAGNRLWPDGKLSEEKFGNLKAELWWLTRTALQRSHEHVLFLEGKPNGVEHQLTDLLALPSGDPDSDALCLQLSLVKWGRNERGKIVIETKIALTRRGISSPDYADALVLTYADPPARYGMLDVVT